MIATGLLWFDDDSRRSLATKVADAAERYRERIGYEPTTCQLHPGQIPAPASENTAGVKPRRRKVINEPAITLRLVPNDQLRPNYFFVGVESGERLKRVPGWSASDEDDYERSRTPRKTTHARAKVSATAAKTAPMATRAKAAPSATAALAAKVTPAAKSAPTAHTAKASTSAPAAKTTHGVSPATAVAKAPSTAKKPSNTSSQPAPAAKVTTAAKPVTLAKEAKKVAPQAVAAPAPLATSSATKRATAKAPVSAAAKVVEEAIPSIGVKRGKNGKADATLAAEVTQPNVAKRGKHDAESIAAKPVRNASEKSRISTEPAQNDSVKSGRNGKSASKVDKSRRVASDETVIVGSGAKTTAKANAMVTATATTAAATTQKTVKSGRNGKSGSPLTLIEQQRQSGMSAAQDSLWADAPAPSTVEPTPATRPARKRRTA